MSQYACVGVCSLFCLFNFCQGAFYFPFFFFSGISGVFVCFCNTGNRIMNECCKYFLKIAFGYDIHYHMIVGIAFGLQLLLFREFSVLHIRVEESV